MNREVGIYRFDNDRRNDVLYNGYEITMNADVRFLEDEKIKAFLISPNEVLIQMPTVDWLFLNDEAKFKQKMTQFNTKFPTLANTHDVHRSMMIMDESLQTRYLLVRFPFALATAPYSTNESEPEMDIDVISSTFNIQGTALSTAYARISWKVAVVETQRRNLVATPDKNKGALRLTAALRGMNIN
jgi:hypothetical protein